MLDSNQHKKPDRMVDNPVRVILHAPIDRFENLNTSIPPTKLFFKSDYKKQYF